MSAKKEVTQEARKIAAIKKYNKKKKTTQADFLIRLNGYFTLFMLYSFLVDGYYQK